MTEMERKAKAIDILVHALDQINELGFAVNCGVNVHDDGYSQAKPYWFKHRPLTPNRGNDTEKPPPS